MVELKFTRDDREFLKEIHVDPEPSPYEVMIDILSRPSMYTPHSFIIAASVADAVEKEYGEVSWENYQRWLMSKGRAD